ncbi:DUF1801 domain-containing protein [Poritiphilus flavus]|uniref:DUF1801 domain-containing protein n=1 Tax=Poritiphilus flavus TaxID=2697053 RepID=A0A6L9E7Q1_9FLAO|nr:DUF1801 domain-containing protein [Poritiphilus flavus]NAS10664.1 DUF1801 domain-containing protein [Poritiphilus flavus]
MRSSASSPEAYLSELPEDRREAMSQLRNTILENIPEGFEETMNYGMIGYVVPHSIYPDGYHCDPKLPLPFINIASQKNFVALYHMGVYSDKKLLDWFTKEYPKYVKTKLDMGKSCIRFKKIETIPYKLIGELCSKISVQQWIEFYEKSTKTNQ